MNDYSTRIVKRVLHLAVAVYLSVSLLLIIGCNTQRPTAQDLAGTYLVSYPHGTETLILKLDGTFEQQYVPKSLAEPLINAGKWWLDDDKSRRLVLEHKMFVSDTPRNEILTPPRYGSTILHIRVIAGVVELVVSSDASLYYQKIASSPL